MTLYKRRMLRERLLLMGLVAVGPMTAYLLADAPIPSHVWMVLTLIGGPIMIGVVTLILHRRECFKRSIIEKNGFVCKKCCYDLRTTRADQCPECGERFDPHELPKYWQKVLRLKDRPSAPRP